MSASNPADWRGRVLTVAVAACFAVGIIAVTDAVRGPSSDAVARDGHSPANVPATGGAGERSIATSFGMLGVHDPRLTPGVAARALAGQSHGINDYVPPERQLVQVPVTLYNASDTPVTYDADHFRLVLRARHSSRDTGTAQVASNNLGAGELVQGASVEGDLAFVIPRSGAELYLLFRDGDELHRVPIGDAGPAYRPQIGDHASHGARHHTSHARSTQP